MFLRISRNPVSEHIVILSFTKRNEDGQPLTFVNLIYDDQDWKRNDAFALSCPAFIRRLDVYRVERVSDNFSLRGYTMHTVVSTDVILSTSRGSVSDVIDTIESWIPVPLCIDRVYSTPSGLEITTEMKQDDQRHKEGNNSFCGLLRRDRQIGPANHISGNS